MKAEQIHVVKSPLNYDDGEYVLAVRRLNGDIFCFIWVGQDIQVREALNGSVNIKTLNCVWEAIEYCKNLLEIYFNKPVKIKNDFDYED